MRLTCPNCSAHYEVADEMIPADGRDVQCSNCGTTWFQEGRGREARAEDAPAVRRPAAQPEAEDAPAEDIPTPDTGSRRPLADEETLDILRQERAHEARRRAAERRRREIEPDEDEADMASAPEPEPAPPADDEPDGRDAAAAEAARMAAAATIARARDADPAAPPPPPNRAQEDVSDAIATAMQDAVGDDDLDDLPAEFDSDADRTGSRRDLLPDIEEINSSLRPDERALEAEEARQAAEGVEVPREESRSGFRIGFLLILILVLLAVAAYLFPAQISGYVPQLAGPLADFGVWVDNLRVALEMGVDRLTNSISSLQQDAGS